MAKTKQKRPRLSQDTIKLIKIETEKGRTAKEISTKTGVSESSIYSARARLRVSGALSKRDLRSKKKPRKQKRSQQPKDVTQVNEVLSSTPDMIAVQSSLTAESILEAANRLGMQVIMILPSVKNK